MAYRSTAHLSAMNRHFSTMILRSWHPYHRYILLPHIDRITKYTICTSIALNRKKAAEENPLYEKRKEMNRLKAERNMKVLGTVEVWNKITVGELTKILSRTPGMLVVEFTSIHHSAIRNIDCMSKHLFPFYRPNAIGTAEGG